MAITATLTLRALDSDDLWQWFDVPEPLVKQTARLRILLETDGLELLYPNYTGMCQAISVWTGSRMPVWQRQAATLLMRYEALDNYDRQEDGWDTRTDNLKHTRTDNLKAQLANTGKDTTTAKVAGYDAGTSALVNREQSEVSLGTGSTTDNTGTQTMDDTGTQSTHHAWRVHGNIGTVTAQDMLKQEREVALYDLYGMIADDFKQRFCLMVY